jgi:hypothetical protein
MGRRRGGNSEKDKMKNETMFAAVENTKLSGPKRFYVARIWDADGNAVPPHNETTVFSGLSRERTREAVKLLRAGKPIYDTTGAFLLV